ncbi:helix-turn-helix domain-containing protein [Nocardia farcinica]|uniref:helix-turn-helix domain-containing protein n=1 Tax=Nocardia farcinica TaxID=37329 RepID=UPI003418F384
MGPEDSPRPVVRCDWERVVMRLPKAVLGPTDKHLALQLAHFGNPDGTSIHPGVKVLARVMCVSERTVIRSLNLLRDSGFLIRIRHGTTRDESDEYRLSVPPNIAELLDHPETLTPNYRPKPKTDATVIRLADVRPAS